MLVAIIFYIKNLVQVLQGYLIILYLFIYKFGCGLAFFASFAVKVPMWPFHTWLPDAHVEAPTEGSVILAGILLKLGGYGFIRFNLSFLPDASIFFTPFIYFLSVARNYIYILYRYCSKRHEKVNCLFVRGTYGFCNSWNFSANLQGLHGAIIQMISHGIISAAFFLYWIYL